MPGVTHKKTPAWGKDNSGDWQGNETSIPGRQNDNISA